MITATLLCVCLTTAGGCKKGSQPAEKPEAVKQTIAMDQPAPAAGQQPTAAEAGKPAPESTLPEAGKPQQPSS
ncbi:MAG: hypothetical protein ACOZBW_01980, partial [Thermodesulfobacteriota bacterium]